MKKGLKNSIKIMTENIKSILGDNIESVYIWVVRSWRF